MRIEVRGIGVRPNGLASRSRWGSFDCQRSLGSKAHCYHITVTCTGVCEGFSGIGTSKERRSLLRGGLNTGASGS